MKKRLRQHTVFVIPLRELILGRHSLMKKRLRPSTTTHLPSQFVVPKKTFADEEAIETHVRIHAIHQSIHG